MIIDRPPGMGYPIIRAATGVDLAVSVAAPVVPAVRTTLIAEAPSSAVQRPEEKYSLSQRRFK